MQSCGQHATMGSSMCSEVLLVVKMGRLLTLMLFWKLYFPLLFPFFPLCRRRLSSRNPDTAHRDQNAAFFSGFLQGCCMGFDSIMQITKLDDTLQQTL